MYVTTAFFARDDVRHMTLSFSGFGDTPENSFSAFLRANGGAEVNRVMDTGDCVITEPLETFLAE